ncbi:hypothetical protein [Streptomyces malaysiensis]|uniref:hypothetical protein n=1 Tax=Streptomyces malaysiensis TaxID=92644 RepID=UPI003678CF04
MSYPDPFDERSPWDEPTETTTTATATEAPVTTPAATADAPENVTLSFKGGSGYDASLLVLRAGSVSEMNELLEKEAGPLKSLLERAAKVQSFNTGLNAPAGGGGGSAPKKFENGRVVNKSTDAGPADDDCQHGRKLVEKANWAALFCQAREKSDQCDPLWRQKDGSYKAK